MKTSVKVLGLGKRNTAKDRKGKEFEFVPVCIAYKSDEIAGYTCATVCVRPDKVPPTLTVGETIDMELSRFRGKLKIVSIG